MLIGILSDSHDHIPLIDAAVADAKSAGAEAVLHCGDLVAPSTLHCLEKYGLPVHVIHGNNTGDLFALTRLAHKPGGVVRFHGMDAGIELGGRRIFIVHYPHYARAMAATGDWDLVCCGHDLSWLFFRFFYFWYPTYLLSCFLTFYCKYFFFCHL